MPRGNCSPGRTHVVAGLFEPLGRAHAGAEDTQEEEGVVTERAQLLPALVGLSVTSGGEVHGEKLSLGKGEERRLPSVCKLLGFIVAFYFQLPELVINYCNWQSIGFNRQFPQDESV